MDYLQHRALTSVEVVSATEDDWTLLSADDRSGFTFPRFDLFPDPIRDESLKLSN